MHGLEIQVVGHEAKPLERVSGEDFENVLVGGLGGPGAAFERAGEGGPVSVEGVRLEFGGEPRRSTR